MFNTLGKRFLSSSVKTISYKHPLSINKFMAKELKREIGGTSCSGRAKCGQIGPRHRERSSYVTKDQVNSHVAELRID